MFPLPRDKILHLGLMLFACISILSLFFIVFFLLFESWTIIQSTSFASYFIDENWHPTDGEYLLLPMIAGSLFIMAGAMLLSVPIGIFTALLWQFYAPRWFSVLLERIIEILSGIPSVVYGFWGIVIIVPLLAKLQAPGTSLLAGIIVLTLIVLPTITLVAHSTLQQINKLHIQNAIALGLSRFTIIRHIVFPQAKRGLLSGVILQAGRAIGETLAVLMVCGNVVQIPGSLFEPVRTLTSNIALEMAYAMDTHRSALFLSGLMLLLTVFLLIFVTEKIKSRETQA